MYIYNINNIDVCDVCIHGVDLAPHHDVSFPESESNYRALVKF